MEIEVDLLREDALLPVDQNLGCFILCASRVLDKKTGKEIGGLPIDVLPFQKVLIGCGIRFGIRVPLFCLVIPIRFFIPDRRVKIETQSVLIPGCFDEITFLVRNTGAPSFKIEKNEPIGQLILLRSETPKFVKRQQI